MGVPAPAGPGPPQAGLRIVSGLRLLLLQASSCETDLRVPPRPRPCGAAVGGPPRASHGPPRAGPGPPQAGPGPPQAGPHIVPGLGQAGPVSVDGVAEQEDEAMRCHALEHARAATPGAHRPAGLRGRPGSPLPRSGPRGPRGALRRSGPPSGPNHVPVGPSRAGSLSMPSINTSPDS